MWQDEGAIDAELVVEVHILAEHAHPLDACPAPNGRSPSEDRVDHDGVRAHAAALEQRAPGEAHAVLDDAAGPNDHVRADPAALADRRTLRHHHIPIGRLAKRPRERLRPMVLQVGEVERGTHEEVGRLLDVHPVAVEAQ